MRALERIQVARTWFLGEFIYVLKNTGLGVPKSVHNSFETLS